eukprot:TRINITY_DN23881_c0_g1_i1.p1 TRINITY_DN23881_c0_g1~~TRINITY_DN23881_c0_g1_i1.p1  ORF type:complete len:301 (-),score=128.76 TRINITY_DN23881_c0_g1_i1:56-901(-)
MCIRDSFKPNSRCGAMGDALATSTATRGDANNAFVSFDANIDEMQMYAVQITVGVITSPSQGLSGFIGLYTVTSSATNYMIIDANPTFADLEWVAPASTTMTVESIADDQVDKANVGLAHNVRFSFKPEVTTYYTGGAVVKIDGITNGFTITGCQWDSIDGNTSAVPAYWPTDCKVDNNAAILIIPEQPPNKKIGVKLAVTNPNAVKNSDVTVKLYRRWNGQLVEQGTATELLKSNWQTTLASSSIETVFGAPGASGTPLQFFKGTATEVSVAFYLSLIHI